MTHNQASQAASLDSQQVARPCWRRYFDQQIMRFLFFALLLSVQSHASEEFSVAYRDLMGATSDYVTNSIIVSKIKAMDDAHQLLKHMESNDIESSKNFSKYVVELKVIELWHTLDSVKNNPWVANTLSSGINLYKEFYEDYGFSELLEDSVNLSHYELLSEIYSMLPLAMTSTKDASTPSEAMGQSFDKLQNIQKQYNQAEAQ